MELDDAMPRFQRYDRDVIKLLVGGDTKMQECDRNVT